MNFGEVQAAVRENLNREGLAATSAQAIDFIRAEVMHWEREALWPPVPGIGERHKWSFLLANHAFVTTALVWTSYALPDDWQNTARVYTIQAGATMPQRCEVADYAYLLEQYGSSTAYAQPHSWALGPLVGGLKQFVVAPISDQVYTGHMTYYKTLTELSGDSATNIWTERYWPGIIQGSSARGFAWLRQHGEKQQWREDAEKALATAIGEDRGATLDEDMVLFISPDVYGTRDEPRPIMSGRGGIREDV